MIDDAVGKTGPINGFIHSAGIELILPLSVTKPAHYQELFATNVIAGFEFARILSKKKYAAPEGGSFVFISSVMGFLGEVAHSAYCSSKGAIIAGVKALALELAEKKIRVNCVSPAQIEGTEMTMKMRESLNDQNKKDIFSMHPLGYGNTDDVAYGCIYLLSDASKWVTGTNLIIDGGYSAK
jgi:NAD(P)-dependent dehydrogenase (short-subunit alcohol dehydrogenase family)